MLKMKQIWAVRGAPALGVCLGMLATVAILMGCSSSSRPPASPAIMTPIEPTATMVAPTATVSAEAAPTEIIPTETVSTEVIPTEAVPTEAVPTEAIPTEAIPTATVAVTSDAGEYAVVETVTKYVQAQVDVPVLNAPVEGAEEIGLIFDGQTALVTGASPDGAWWRIICSDDSVGDCWVAADPAMVLPTAAQ